MPFTKKSSSTKKQASMPGPNSPAYKKLLSAQQNASAKDSGKSAAKSGKPSKSFTSLRSRQRIVEEVKRAIWAKVREINDSIITLALAGNYLAAKALFDFAGVYTLPSPDQEPPAQALAAADPAANAAPADEAELTNPINAFFRSIGVEPPGPTPSLAAENA